jgi:hypothetical protein
MMLDVDIHVDKKRETGKEHLRAFELGQFLQSLRREGAPALAILAPYLVELLVVQVGVGKRRIASVCHHFFSVRLEVLKP